MLPEFNCIEIPEKGFIWLFLLKLIFGYLKIVLITLVLYLTKMIRDMTVFSFFFKSTLSFILAGIQRKIVLQ